MHNVPSNLLLLASISKVLPNDLVWLKDGCDSQRPIEEHELLKQLPLIWKSLSEHTQGSLVLLLEDILDNVFCFTILEDDKNVLD